MFKNYYLKRSKNINIKDQKYYSKTSNTESENENIQETSYNIITQKNKFDFNYDL